MSEAVLLVSHGTVDNLDDLAAFVTHVRHGHAPAPELVAELRRRYETIGGRSPLNATSAELAGKLQRHLGVPVAWANRLWRPYVREVLGSLAHAGVRRVALVPLAQHSAHVYAEDAGLAAESAGVSLACAPNWGHRARLHAAFAVRIASALQSSPDLERTTLVMTAHSLPRSVVDAGDPYERELRSAANGITAIVRERLGSDMSWVVAFQSQGISVPGGRPLEWLGPDLRTTLDDVKARGHRHVVFAPVGFLADHVEILYDLDVEARALARERGLSYARTPSLNADDDLVQVLAEVAGPLLGHD
jgi:protoporphyrin/coproporphyrin ferrochelatase